MTPVPRTNIAQANTKLEPKRRDYGSMSDVSTSAAPGVTIFLVRQTQTCEVTQAKICFSFIFHRKLQIWAMQCKILLVSDFLCIQNPHRLIAKLNQSLIPSKYVDRSRFGCAPGLISTKSAKLQIQFETVVPLQQSALKRCVGSNRQTASCYGLLIKQDCHKVLTKNAKPSGEKSQDKAKPFFCLKTPYFFR